MRLEKIKILEVNQDPGEKAKFARSSESLPTGLLCNQYNREIRRQIRDMDSGQVPRLLETKKSLTYEKVSFRFKRSGGGFIAA